MYYYKGAKSAALTLLTLRAAKSLAVNIDVTIITVYTGVIDKKKKHPSIIINTMAS